jgi:putative sigma-54 modulation protein
MQIDIKGRNVPVTPKIRAHVERRLAKVARQVSDLARLEIEIFREPNPRVSDCQVAEATLYLKGVTLRAQDASPEMLHSLNLMADDLARQVKRHRDKLRRRREAHAASARAMARAVEPAGVTLPSLWRRRGA